VSLSADLWEWYQSFVNGEGVVKNGLIALANDMGIPLKIWSFSNGIPIKWTGPSLNATTSAVAIESLEIAHEKLDMVELLNIKGF
jgi:phage tail-like protein